MIYDYNSGREQALRCVGLRELGAVRVELDGLAEGVGDVVVERVSRQGAEGCEFSV